MATQAIGYVRVSTTDQATEGISLEAQRSKIEAWATANNAELVAVFEDAGISGATVDHREGLQAAVAEACRRKAALVVYSLSRFSRSTRDTLELAEQLDRGGAGLVSLSERLDASSASGKMTFRLLAVLAEFERDQVSERTKSAMAHLRSQGRRTSRFAPYGFAFSPEGQVVPCPAELDAIGKLRAWRKAGLSYRAIQRRANRELPCRGKGWGLEVVHQIASAV